MKKILLVFVSLAFIMNTYGQDKKASSDLERQNKELVKSYFTELCNTTSDDLTEFVDKYISSNFILHLPGEEIHGKEGLEEHYASSKKSFTDPAQPIYDIIVEGDKVAFRGEFMAVQPNGNEIKTTFAGFWKIQEGKIVEWWSEYDALGMMQQLGMELRMKE
jgi:predicted ester cyclase